MRDYAELVERLRICPDYNDGCKNCPHEHDLGCRSTTMREAADAIEELQAYADLYKELTEKGQTVARNLLDAYPKWISVEERLPEDGESIIAVIEDYSTWDDENDDIAVSAEPNGAMTVIGIYRNKRFRWYDESGVATIDMNDSDIENLGLRLVSWMPLPEPPKEDGNA